MDFYTNLTFKVQKGVD